MDITTEITNALGLGGFNFTRQIHAQPFSWYIAGAVALAVLWECICIKKTDKTEHVRAEIAKAKSDKPKIAKAVTVRVMVVALCIVSFCFAAFARSGTQVHYFNNVGAVFGWNDNTFPTYAQFYDNKLFDEIASDIGRPKNEYRVGSVGMFPVIASMNGFYTVDGYVQGYSLDYWHSFRAVIGGELERNEKPEQYFNWGNRYYLFSSELYKDKSYGNYLYSKHYNKEITLNYDFTALKTELGCEYIFSAVKIENLSGALMKEYLGKF